MELLFVTSKLGSKWYELEVLERMKWKEETQNLIEKKTVRKIRAPLGWRMKVVGQWRLKIPEN